MGRYPAKSPTSLRNCALKRRSGHTAFGFWSIPCEKSRQPSEIYPEKTFTSGILSAFGQSPAKSPVSLRRYTPEKCLRPSASGCLFPPIARLPKRPAAMTRKKVAPDSLRLWIYTEQKTSPASGNVPRKSTAPDSLRLWIYTEQKNSPAFGDLPRKNVHARQPSAFGQSFSENLSSGPLR